MNKKRTYFTIAIIAILVIAGLLYWYINRPVDVSQTELNTSAIEQITDDEQQNTEDDTSAPSEGSENQIFSQGTNQDTIVMSTQFAGENIVIDQAYLSKPGFVVIYRSGGGQKGEIAGRSGLLRPGAVADVVISAIPQANATYIAVLYADNGDGSFNASSDTPVIFNGSEVSTTFTAKN